MSKALRLAQTLSVCGLTCLMAVPPVWAQPEKDSGLSHAVELAAVTGNSTMPGYQTNSTMPGYQTNSTRPGYHSDSTRLGAQSDGARAEYKSDAVRPGYQSNSTKPVYQGVSPVIHNQDDGDLEDAVERAVSRHKDVSVSVDKGVATLTGKVTGEAERKEAVNAARGVAGVRSVHDQLQVSGVSSQTVGEYIDDAAITAAVKSKFVAESGLSNFKISVDTIDGVVTLTGDVKSRELVERAGTVASHVKGVRRVDNKLLVKP